MSSSVHFSHPKLDAACTRLEAEQLRDAINRWLAENPPKPGPDDA